ncbi:MAG TPA: glycosyltransferase family 39 protein [Gaiellaceae bacterium]|nr:glycosyltransferase family 39 protein [Gaiellaceae bacterium]
MAPPSRSRAESSVFNATRLAVAAIVVAGGLLRFIGLEHQSFESDELVTLSLVHKSFSGMLTRIPHSEATPPVYYIFIWAWTHVVGRSDAGLRSMSALFGTATVPVAYLVGRTMLRSRSGGLIVAALLAVAPVMIWYSQEARSYALFVFFGALSLLYFARSLDTPARANLGGWAVSSSFAIATHYFAGFLVLAETILLIRRLRHRFAPALAFVLAVTAALTPLAYHQYRGAGAKWAWFKRANPGSRLHELLERFLFFNYNPGRTPCSSLPSSSWPCSPSTGAASRERPRRCSSAASPSQCRSCSSSPASTCSSTATCWSRGCRSRFRWRRGSPRCRAGPARRPPRSPRSRSSAARS